MGTYATTTALDIVMIGVNFDTATSALATKVITQAENKINQFLSKRYDLSSSTFQTSTSIPPQVTTLCEQLAEGYMWQKNSRSGKESIQRGKDLVEEALKDLKAIAEYKANILDTTGAIIPDASTSNQKVLCNTSDYTNTFNEDDELSWAIDADKLEDIYNDRD
jgi:hypothetical protein